MSENNSAVSRVQQFSQDLDEELRSFDSSSNRNRKWAHFYMLGGAVFSTLTTILLGWQGTPESYVTSVKNVALVCSAIVTVFSTLNAFYNHRQLWIRYTITWAKLKSIKKDLCYLLASSRDDKDPAINDLRNRFKEVLAEADESWIEIRNEKK